MYRTLFTTMLLSFLCFQGFAQPTQNLSNLEKVENAQVQEWIQENPHVKLVSLGHFHSISQGERDELTSLNMRLLHEKDMPMWSEIEAFEVSGFSEGLLDMNLLNDDMIFVSNWLAQNQDVKIVTMEEFGLLNAEQRNQILNMDNVIICNGTLLKSDIIAYESN